MENRVKVHVNKNIIVLRIIVSLLWATYSIFVLLGQPIVYDLLSPLTAITAVFLAYKSYKTVGEYKWTEIFFAMGFIFWFASDLLLILCTYYSGIAGVLFAISDKLYLMPEFMFFLGVCDYVRVSFKRTDFLRMMSDTFVFTFIVFLLTSKLFGLTGNISDGIDVEMLGNILYYYAVLFVFTLLAFVIIETGLIHHTRAWYMLGVATAIYNILETRYAFCTANGIEPENVYLDIIYLACIVASAIALSDPELAYVGGANSDHPFTKIRLRTSKSVVWINAGITAAVGIVMFVKTMITVNEIYCILIIALAYIVIQKSAESSDLFDRLLHIQMSENARLEKLVNEKTSELQQANSRPSYISTVDALTGLYNRRYCAEEIKKLAARKADFVVFSMDLNHFKPINDNYGHDMGDLVLKEISRRLKEIYPDICSAYRMGGDEFMIILRSKLEEDKDIDVTAQKVANAICEACDLPIAAKPDAQDNANEFVVSTSCGVAFYPRQTSDVEELFKFADSAMYAIKHTKEKSSYKIYE